MGMHLGPLVAMSFGWLFDLYNWGLIAQVAVGLGMVIFVHELGHFLVAKACGVKCEKFYLGFDIFGLKLARFQWGETEYGIGILPLGGYVKMLGQEDNPVKAAEELERARISHGAPAGAAPAGGEPAPETSIFDPRSYLAKSVPKRMAIISAGVIMNVIFAFAMAMVAYGIGVKEVPCVVGSVLPGSPAWKVGLRPGDEVVQIGNVRNPRFRDLKSGVVLGNNIEQGVPFVVRREGQPDLLHFTIVPEKIGLAPRVGIGVPETTTLADPPVLPAMPAEGAGDKLKKGDVIVAIDGRPVASYTDVDRAMATHADSLSITVRRTTEAGTSDVLIDLPPRPLKQLGLVMEIGPIVAVQKESPAAAAEIEKGDVLERIDGQAIGNPETLAARLAARAGDTITVTVRRGDQSLDRSIALRSPYDVTPIPEAKVPAALNGMGVAFEVTNRVAEVVADGPAGRAGIKPGATVVSATLTPPEDAETRKGAALRKAKTLPLGPDAPNWTAVCELLQMTLPDTTVTLTLADNSTMTLKPELSRTEFNPDRGLNFEPMFKDRRATSALEAAQLGADETVESVTQVYRFLSKIGTQISPKGMSGPLGILNVAYYSASSGFSDLLIFLTMLSANLAVLNFLPIPLLDGGHMVFLIYEGIRGKPASERIILAFHYAGFFFIIGLMTFVFMLDLGLISRTP
ncbi:MAG: site-2 protease family protein [Planctomycetia bacterium]|nr:site-2 protease family protein [Planctomycetia bacterium]